MFAAVVCKLLLAALPEAALLTRPAALVVIELFGLVAPFAVLLVLEPLAAFTVLVPPTPFVPLVPFVLFVPMVLFVFALLLSVLFVFALLGALVFCGGSRGGKTGSEDETGETLTIVLLAETR